MNMYILTLFILAHILGDFYFQSDKLSQKKEVHYPSVLIHSLYYTIAMFLVIIPVFSLKFLLLGIVFSLAHLCIDSAKFISTAKKAKQSSWSLVAKRNIFFLDQIAHLLFICFVLVYFPLNDKDIQILDFVSFFLNRMGLSPRMILTWISLAFLIHKPTNIAITTILAPYKPNMAEPTSQETNNTDKNAGRIIGTLERAIIIILIFLKQYSAIGLVLTAKSIARYDKIAKEPSFSEYYLLGTLLSTLMVILYAIVFFPVI